MLSSNTLMSIALKPEGKTGLQCRSYLPAPNSFRSDNVCHAPKAAFQSKLLHLAADEQDATSTQGQAFVFLLFDFRPSPVKLYTVAAILFLCQIKKIAFLFHPCPKRKSRGILHRVMSV